MRLALGAALLVAIGAIYGQTTGFDFLTWDDPEYITSNEQVLGGLTLEGLRWAATTDHASNWHPLTWLSHMLDVEMHGTDAAGHHLTNVLLHALNTLLLFTGLSRLTGSVWRSALVAGWFAVHPLHVESVAWVSERKDLLSSTFGLLAIGVWARYARNPRRATYLLVAALMGASLLAKPTLVTFPVLLLLLDVWPLRRLDLAATATTLRRLVLEKVPLLVLSLLSTVATLSAQRRGGAMEPAAAVAWGDRILNAAVAYPRYLLKMIWPRSLSPLYPHPELPGGIPLSALTVAASLLVLAAISVVVLRERRRGYPPVGWAWFLVALLPMSGLIQVGPQAMADRYTYLALVGPFVLLAWGLAELSAGRSALRRSLAVAALASLLVLAGLARGQAAHWRNSADLYRHAVEVTPHNPAMLVNLGVELRRDGDVEGAMQHYREALAIDPERADAHNALANALMTRGATEEAIVHYGRATETAPGYAEAQFNLALALDTAGRGGEADERYRRALDSADRSPAPNRRLQVEALSRLARRAQLAGRLHAARADYRRLISVDPDNLEARVGLGQTLAASGHFDEALTAFVRARELDPDDPDALGGEARILATHPRAPRRDGTQAVELAERLVRNARIADPRYLDTLAAAYAEAGRFEEAVRTQSLAIERARVDGSAAWLASFAERLALYRRSLPYHEPATTRKSTEDVVPGD